MSRKCQLLMGYCSKGLGNSNTNRIERFVIGATSSSLKVPFSNICYRLQLLAEETRALYRYRGDESTHASSMRYGEWGGRMHQQRVPVHIQEELSRT